MTIPIKKIFNSEKLWLSIFIVSTIVTFIYNNLHYNLSRAPDFQYYVDYISYFYGNMESTTREQGLIYFFLVSLVIKLTKFDFGATGYELILSNGVLVTNYLLYLIGLMGLFQLLKLKKFNKSNIFFTFAVMCFFPQTNNLLLTMKPEIIAFSFLPWSLLLITKFLDEDKIKYLYLALFPNIILLSTKATIIGAIGLIYLYILINNWEKFNKISFIKFFVISLFLLSVIFYENFLANGKLIFEHTNTKLSYQDVADISILYNVNFRELITNPFRHLHADSLIGIIALDTFGDYFQNYALQDNSLFAYSTKKIPSISFISHWTQFISINLTLVFYFFIIKFSRNLKADRLFYLLPFFGLIILIIQAFGVPQVNFNASMADTFKTHYYSYLVVISFSFIVVTLSTQFLRIKSLIFVLMVFSFFNLYGLLKNDVPGYTKALTMKNNYSVSCQLNDFLTGSLINGNCGSKEVRICKTPQQLIDKNYLNSKNTEDLNYSYYAPGQVFYFNDQITVPRTTQECLSLVNNKFKHKTYLDGTLKVPYLNLFFYLLSLASIIYLFFNKDYKI